MKKSWVFGVWDMVTLAIQWPTWKEKNWCSFEDKATSVQDFKLYFLRMLYSWSAGHNDNKNLNFFGFVDYIMDESLMLDVFVFFPSVHG